MAAAAVMGLYGLFDPLYASKVALMKMAFKYLRWENKHKVLPICSAALKGARHFPKRANVSSIRDGEICHYLSTSSCKPEVLS